MGAHEEFLELCAAATAGELDQSEQARLESHLKGCSSCRQAMQEYEVAARRGIAALSQELEPHQQQTDGSFSLEEAEKAFFARLDREGAPDPPTNHRQPEGQKPGRRFAYRPSQIPWNELWMPFAAAILLSIALGIASYRTGMKQGTDTARLQVQPTKDPGTSLEEQASDAGYERSRLIAQLAESAKTIENLKRQLAETSRAVEALEKANIADESSIANGQHAESGRDPAKAREDQLALAQHKLTDLEKALGTAATEREEAAGRAAALEVKVNELSQLLRDRERAIDLKEVEVAKRQELLEHDRDIRELMGARDLYMADVHDVTKIGTDKTYGRVFYTKGKSLIFYAFDLDAQPGVENASSFQAWGRRGPDKYEARSLGIFYEDNASKKRWVLKASYPKTLEDIDAVFVTVEPNGGSHHPSGKQLLFAYLRVSPNHP